MPVRSDHSSDASAKAAGNTGSPPNPSSTGESAKKERRDQMRVRTRTLANGGVAGNAARKGGSFLGTTVNLSVGGCLLRTYEALESGMEVTLCLKLPEGQITTRAQIAHVNEDAVGCRMVGVKFLDVPGDAHTLLVQHISTFTAESSGGGASGRFAIEGRIHTN